MTDCSLQPLCYHNALCDYLREQEPEQWRWYSSDASLAEYAASLRLDLLKSTYRLDPEHHGEPYQLARKIMAVLELEVPVTLYQSQESGGRNAALFYLPGEAHVVLQGDLLDQLAPAELEGVLAHELAHFLLWQMGEGEYLVADRLIRAIAGHARAESSHVQSAIWYSQYTEIFADRAALLVTGDINPVVSGLVKVITGLTKVSAESYLKQANEIFADATVEIHTEDLSHPEAFIRARALDLWSQKGAQAEQEIRRIIEGPLKLGRLDLPGQQQLTELTRQMLVYLLAPAWFRTESVLGQAVVFFDEGQLPKPWPSPDPAVLDQLEVEDEGVRDYLCYLMLDFAAVDARLDELPLARSMVIAEQLGIRKTLTTLANKELRVTKKRLAALWKDAEEMLANADRSDQAEEETP